MYFKDIFWTGVQSPRLHHVKKILSNKIFHVVVAWFAAGEFYATPRKMYYTYLLESQKDSGWYIGYTNNLKDRFLEHSQGRVISTKNRLPIKLIYYEAYLNRLDAKKRERFLKSGSGRKFLKKQLTNYLINNK